MANRCGKNYMPYPYAQPLEKYANDIVHNKIIHIHPIQHLITKDTCGDFLKLVENNTSIKSIFFCGTDYVDLEFFKLLNTMLKNNTTLEVIQFAKTNISYESCKLLMDSLNCNKSIKRLILNELLSFHQIKLIIELLKVNKTLTELYIFDGFVDHDAVVDIVNALKDNPCITSLHVNVNIGCKELQDRINKYCNRNTHNTKLKSMSLVDLCEKSKKDSMCSIS